MARLLTSFALGLLFGLGLVISEMVNPAKVLSFLDVFGAWDPSLILVMGSALATAAIGYRLVFARPKPLLAPQFQLPQKSELDPDLILGAVLFGVGWGLSGLCPGPALTSLSYGVPDLFVFAAALLGGIGLFRIWRFIKPEAQKA